MVSNNDFTTGSSESSSSLSSRKDDRLQGFSRVWCHRVVRRVVQNNASPRFSPCASSAVSAARCVMLSSSKSDSCTQRMLRALGMIWDAFGMVWDGLGCFGADLGCFWDGLGCVWDGLG